MGGRASLQASGKSGKAKGAVAEEFLASIEAGAGPEEEVDASWPLLTQKEDPVQVVILGGGPSVIEKISMIRRSAKKFQKNYKL